MIVFYIHIPKCAGTSARGLLSKASNPSSVLWLDLNRETMSSYMRRCHEAIESDPALLFCGGHFTVSDVLASMPTIRNRKDICFCSIVRDPFERFCSHYEYHQRVLYSKAPSYEKTNADALRPQVGIYNTGFGLAGRKYLSYYLGDPSNHSSVIDSFASTTKMFPCLFTSNFNINLILFELAYHSEFSGDSRARNELASILPHLGSIENSTRLNVNPDNTSYSLRYPDEYAERLDWFADDYTIFRFCASSRLGTAFEPQ